MNSLSPDGQTLMSAESPWGLKYTGSTVFDHSTGTGTGSVPVTASHTLSHSHIEEVEQEENSSRGKHYSRRCTCRCCHHHQHHEGDGRSLHFTSLIRPAVRPDRIMIQYVFHPVFTWYCVRVMINRIHTFSCSKFHFVISSFSISSPMQVILMCRVTAFLSVVLDQQ
jgi:hypothetical protein